MLDKTLNLRDLTVIGVGNIIGGGIFTLISNSTKYSKGYTWLAFLISAKLIRFRTVILAAQYKLWRYTYLERHYSAWCSTPGEY